MYRARAVSLFVLCASALHAQTAGVPLTLEQAEQMALRNHPRIAVSRNLAGSAAQRVTEARSDYYPKINGEVTASQGYDQSRIGAGALAASVLFNRFGAGLQVNQLVTDFGRTKNLVDSSNLQAQAADQSAQATRDDVVLNVNRAFFEVLQAQAFVTVAEETLKERQSVAEQVSALAKAQLKSQIDVSFAQVNVEQARLLLLRAQDGVKEGQADLSRAIGEDHPVDHQIQDVPGNPVLPPDDTALLNEAVQNRPELRELRLRLQAAQKFEAAERDLKRPNVNLLAVGGVLPYLNQDPRTVPREYEGAAVNVEVPVFNGHLFSARREAAAYEAAAAEQRSRDLQQQVGHDVHTAWLSASTAFQRIPVTDQLVKQAQQALDLAQGRYNLGLSSIVEITQAQLSLTQALIENVNARYDYRNAYANLQYTLGDLR